MTESKTSNALPKSSTLDNGADSTEAVETPANQNPFAGKGSQFWLVFLALCVSCFLSALDLTAVSTALPASEFSTLATRSVSGYLRVKGTDPNAICHCAVAAEFQSTEFSWVGSAYALTSTALIPWTGGFAAIFGRKATMLGSLALFAIGSAVVGSAHTMEIVILGRAIQGIGGGGILTMTEIVVVDLVPLAERGAFFGIFGAVWAFASAIGPPIGGALASAGAWRWLFYLNLPLTGVAAVLVIFFLRIKAPQTTLKEKLAQMDYFNLVFVAGATSTILGLTWGGVTYSWSSYEVLVPLIIGLSLMGLFLWLEKTYAKYPTVPFDVLRHRSSLLGFMATFLHGIVTLAAIYYMTVYFQASKMATPVKAGVDTFSLSLILFWLRSTIAPMAIVTGVSIGILGTYRKQNLFGWALAMIGFGLTSMLKYNSSKAAWTGPIIAGIGMGILYSATNFPVLAPLKPSQQPHAMAFFAFVRSFGQVLGISIGSTILQNQLAKNLPEAFLAMFHGNAEIAFPAIPIIPTLAEPIRSQVRGAFALSLRVIWLVMIGISGLGLIISFFLRDIELTKEMDDKWGMSDKQEGTSAAAEMVEQRV
ncbi:BZ3500_MvSof-1268-A1-R1_Chr1-3g01871 [Microbotryum saponariae]|uniref:BZ3500_MvSof-1268-A1-R1_Chr1-3g01871 protein n=1 Tax=Microbotryum saponariae TaxID=289078 RepID=A0A2X0L3R0_9BASI|nr:BZ3500_MvSof-1268-A1-R1_Chr1-3g01871 [Microbotryum saponariae]SCZ94781.1 BZ3501_MvSof-1269-A2-R1_Chr1-3g01473 [Microbotryum saponariae]